MRNAMRNTQTAADIAQDMTTGGFDLILTSGTQVLQAVANANQGSETVQVFGLVANPFNAGIGLDLSHDWHAVGQSAGEMAGDILSGTDPIAIALQPDRLRLVPNETALTGLTWSRTPTR